MGENGRNYGHLKLVPCGSIPLQLIHPLAELPHQVPAVFCRRAEVVRDSDTMLAAVATAMAEAGERRTQMVTDQDEAREGTWRERALNAEDALKAAHAEIIAQRTRIGELLGQVRDLEAERTEEAIQRITTENTTLKQRVRQFTTDNRTLDERLKAARSNLRFQDRRVADIEAQIADPGTG
jgi:chromosome segregation ATPase